MTYRDMSFCNAFAAGRCTNAACRRAYTHEERQRAVAWWGGPDVPVAYSDFSPYCLDYKSHRSTTAEVS